MTPSGDEPVSRWVETMFPKLSSAVSEHPPIAELVMPMPHATNYLAAVLPQHDEAVKYRFTEVFTKGYGTLHGGRTPHELASFSSRMSAILSTVDFLKRFIPFPPLQILVTNKKKVQFCSTMG